MKEPKSQGRIPVGKVPQMWGQSLYVLCKLIHEVVGGVVGGCGGEVWWWDVVVGLWWWGVVVE